jgi:hypothetical protein
MSVDCPEATANKAEYSSAAHVLLSLSSLEKGIKGNWKRAKPFHGVRLILLPVSFLDSLIPSPILSVIRHKLLYCLPSLHSLSMGILYLDFTLEQTS